MNLEKIINNETEMLAFGKVLSQSITFPMIIYFVGNLGAGKTTLIRGVIQGLGYQGRVKSPTYTLVEPYTLLDKEIFHFDLYRIKDPEELDLIGIEDYFNTNAVCLIEWPEMASEKLPKPDITCYIETINVGRKIRLETNSEKGKATINKLEI